MPVFAGTVVRALPLNCDVNVSIACGVAAAINHVVAPVCTWTRKDLELCLQGSNLVTHVAEANKKMHCKQKDLHMFIEQLSVFGMKWNAEIGLPMYRDYGLLEEETVMYVKTARIFVKGWNVFAKPSQCS